MRFNEFKIIKEMGASGITLGPKKAVPGAPPTKDKEISQPANAFNISVPTSRSGPEVADIQKALIALGYSLPKHGVDGIRGPETKAAVKKFQQDNMLTVDGDPGPKTVAALNRILGTKPEVAKTLTHSTLADIKVKTGGASISPSDVADYLKSKGLDSNQILGILTNIQGESSFRPGVTGDGGTSGGLFQHHANRFTDMVTSAGDDWATNWKGQIDFALSEKPGRTYMNTKFKSPEEATAWWTRYFEIPADIPGDTRKRIAMIPNFQTIA